MRKNDGERREWTTKRGGTVVHRGHYRRVPIKPSVACDDRYTCPVCGGETQIMTGAGFWLTCKNWRDHVSTNRTRDLTIKEQERLAVLAWQVGQDWDEDLKTQFATSIDVFENRKHLDHHGYVVVWYSGDRYGGCVFEFPTEEEVKCPTP